MRTFFIALLCLLAQLSLASAAQPLRIAVDVPYPPFSYVDETGQLAGFDIDIAKALCAQLQVECDIKAMAFDDIIPAIVAGKVDISIAGMAATDERKKLVDFSERYYRSHSIFVERSGAHIDPANLKGKRIAAQAGTIQEEYLKEKYSGIGQIHTYKNFDELPAALQKGDVDLVLMDGLSGYEYLKTPAGQTLELVGEPVHSDILSAPSSIAVSKNQPQLTAQINKAIQAIRSSGEYARINRKYFDFTIY